MNSIPIDQSAVKQFKNSLQGALLTPEDPQYNEARSVWNGMIDRKPALIVQCANVNDVKISVKFAREHSLLISIKGGGHGVAGKAVCNDGLMLDMCNMNSVHVDTERQVATVGPGARLGDMDKETAKYGLVTTGGIVSTTGVAGLTLGGGIGYLARKYGLTLDNLLAAEIVTANGDLLHCSTDEYPDLFWALRGGGGNFGVVTSFQFRLHKQDPNVLTAQIFSPMSDAPLMMRKYRELMADAPDDLAAYAVVVKIPPVEPFPSELHGKPAFFLLACYAGDHAEGHKLLDPLKDVGSPILAVVDVMPYMALQQNFDAGMPKGGRYYWKSCFFREITDDAIQIFVEHAANIKGSMTMLGFESLGGAIGRVDPSATAFIARDANFALGFWCGWVDANEDEEIITWTRNFNSAMAPFASDGVYSNYLDQDDDAQTISAYGTSYERLQSIKTRYDPDNFFSQNFNISPK